MSAVWEYLRPLASAGWRGAWMLGLGMCVGALLANAFWSDVSPSTPWGTAYGVGAAALLVVACAYSARRRMPRRGPLPAHTWLRLHVFGGTFFLLLVLMHSGLRLPTGALGWGLWVVSLWTALSGAVGLVIQWWIPKALSSGLATEVHYDRIPALVAGLAERAEALVTLSSESVRRYYSEALATAMSGPQPRLIYFVDVTGGIQEQVRNFDYLSRFADPEEGQRLAELRDLFRTKLEVDAHYTLQRALRWWVYGHVPLVGLLVVLVLVHIASILYY